MTKKELTDFYRKIKSHYYNFDLDPTKLKDWSEKLINYSVGDIYARFQKHLENPTYSSYAPNIGFLTANLLTETEKVRTASYTVLCPFCQQQVLLDNYEKHFSRCSSIEYFSSKLKLLSGKNVNKTLLRELSEEEFNKKYNEMLLLVKSNSLNDAEKIIIDNIIKSEKREEPIMIQGNLLSQACQSIGSKMEQTE